MTPATTKMNKNELKHSENKHMEELIILLQ